MSTEINAQDSLTASIRQQPDWDPIVGNHAATSDCAALAPDAGITALQRAAGGIGILRLGLIDAFQLSRECLATVLGDMYPKPVIASFASVQDYASHPDRTMQLVLYVAHDSTASEPAVLRDMAALRQAAHGVPIIVLSEAESIDPAPGFARSSMLGRRASSPCRQPGSA